MTNPLSRTGFNHPAQSTAGDGSLYTSIEAIYQAIGDDLTSRWFTSPSLANGATVTLTHSLNLAFVDLDFRFYTYTGTFTSNITALTRATRGPAGVSVIANVTNPTTQIDVTNNTGGTISLATLVVQLVAKAAVQNLAVSSNITLVDKTLHLVSTAAARSLTLPAPTSGAYIAVIDSTGQAETNNITVSQNASETIDGATSYVVNLNYGAVIFVSDGTNWFITGQRSKGSYVFDDTTGWDGSATSVSYTIAGLGIDTRKANWTLKDSSQNYLQTGCDITHTGPSNVTVTVGIALAAGTYRLVGTY